MFNPPCAPHPASSPASALEPHGTALRATTPDPGTSALRLVTGRVHTHAARRASLLAGLLERPARIAPKFFYDAQGCALYGAICELQEYYPTRTERALLERHRAAIARHLPRGAQWVDLGCGDGSKSLPWLAAIQARRYVGVDVSPTWLARAAQAVEAARSGIECVGVVTDFEEPLDLHPVLSERPHAPPVLFYPGSSIGNFEPQAAAGLLVSFARHTGPEGALLIGADLVKDRALLEAAYDDALGVTAAFNRNVLRVVNRELDANFEPRAFDHVARYDAAHQRIEMRLVSRRPQEVRLGKEVRHFEAGESILTEYSHKYTVEGFEAMLRAAGYGQVRHWTDPHGWFAVFLARAS